LSTKKPKVLSLDDFWPIVSLILSHSVDENLFYKGVDKKAVHGARLHQSHHVSQIEEMDSTPEANGDTTKGHLDSSHPPYPFDTANTLLALTRKHNVSFLSEQPVERRF
jgi:hypothetical protein